MSSFGECKQFARRIFGATESGLANEPLAQQIAQVILHLVSLTAVGLIGDVLCGNDAELGKIDERADLGIAEAIAAIAVIERAARVIETHIGPGRLGRAYNLFKCFAGPVAAITFALRSVA